MKRAQSGLRGVFWRHHPNGSQEVRRPDGGRARGEWWIRWTCSYGHLHREKIGPKALAEAEYHRRKTETRREEFCPRISKGPRRVLFEDAVAEYLEWAKVNKRSWKDDEQRLRGLRVYVGGNTLGEVTVQDVERIKSDLLRQHSAATVNRYLGCLRQLFNRAIRNGQAERNPVKLVRFLQENNTRVRWLTEEEEAILLPAIPEPYRSFCRIAIYTGLRKGELLGLTWDRLDFKAEVLTVDRSKHGEARRVPMNSLVQDVLRRIPRRLGEHRVFPGCRKISHRFSAWAKAAGLLGLRFHDLRHTFASRLVMAGVDLLTVKELLGHKTLAMTLRYSHLSPGHQRQAIERLVTARSGTAISTSVNQIREA